MKVTDEMVQRAHAAYWCSTQPANEPKMRRALEAALADVVVPSYPGRTPEEETELRKHPEFEPGVPTYVEWLREEKAGLEAQLAEERAEHRATASEFRSLRERMYAVRDWRCRVEDRPDLAELDGILGETP